MAAEAESWDADFADGGKEERTDVLLPSRLRMQSGATHDADEAWDAEFEGDDTPVLQVKGRTADRIDPGAQDSEWTGDFAWSDDKKLPSPVAKSNDDFDPAEKIMKRRKTEAVLPPMSATVVITTRDRTVIRLKELLPAIPEPVLSDDAFLKSNRGDTPLEVLLPPPLAPDAIIDFPEQLHLLQEAASMAVQRSDKIAESSARSELSVLLARAGRSAEACRESEAVTATMMGGIGKPGWESVHAAMLGAARAAARGGDSTSAVEHALKALGIADEREATAQVGECHQLLGTLLFASDFDSSAHHFASHLKAACQRTPEDRKGWRELGMSCWHVARLLQSIQEVDLAEKYAGRAVDSAAKARDAALFAATSSLYDGLVATRGNKKADDKEEVEWGTDWDAEMGPVVEAAPAKELSSSSGKHSERLDGGGDKNKDITIVKYPAPTLLYSLRPNEGHRLFSEERQEEWLSSLLTRHPRALALLSARRVGASQVPRKTDAYQRRVAKLTRNSPEALLLLLTHCVDLSVCGARLQAWGFLSDGMAWSGPELTAQLTEDNYLLVLSLLNLAARLCHTEREARFAVMIQATQAAFPRHSLALQLLQLETLAHHGRATAAQFRNLSVQAKGANDNGVASLALADLYIILRGLSPLTTAPIEGAAEESEDSEELSMDEQALLESGYTSVTPAQSQAKVAFVLGHQAAHGNANHKLAERVFLEAVYLLDSTRPTVGWLPPLLCELGSNALVQLGEVLLYNLKYKYAVQALSSALLSFRLRGKRNYYPLLHRLASIAADQQDLRRAVQLYHEILAHYTEERKVTEAVYVSEILSKLHTDAGELRAAEDYLHDALALLPPVTENEKIDGRAFQLLIKISSLHLLSYRSDRAVELLERLRHMEAHLPAGKAPVVYTQLAESYMAKEWFEDARVALRKAEELTNSFSALS